MNALSMNPDAIAWRTRYHHEEHYRQTCLRSSKMWQGRNREIVNMSARLAYLTRPDNQKLERLATIKLKRKLGYWKKR